MSTQIPGPLIRLWGLKRAQLPPTTATPAELTPFLTSLLQEAVPFIDSASPKSSSSPAPSSQWKHKSTKSLPASTAPVRLLERRIPAALLAPAAASLPTPLHPERVKDETWACRLSVHEDAPRPGTASWSEFRAAIGEQHAATEAAFTPSVVARRRAVEWDCGGVKGVRVGTERWGRFTLGVEEMRHAVGRPVLRDRAFAVLLMTASVLGDDGEEREEFVVVSVTVTDFGEAPEAEVVKGEDVVVGAYASVERVRKLPGVDQIEWVMATASDARGTLPMWVQTRAVPVQIAKDVGLFLGWIAKERKKGDGVRKENMNDGNGDGALVSSASET